MVGCVYCGPCHSLPDNLRGKPGYAPVMKGEFQRVEKSRKGIQMPYYENVYIARQEISAQQVDALTDGFEDIIKQAGGSITKRENWGLKSLAYRIKKSRKAHYTLLNIDATADAVHEMERQMRLNEDVLRYLTLRVDELDGDPSIQAQNKSNRSYDDGTEGEFRARSSDKPESKDEREDALADQPPADEAAASAATALVEEAPIGDGGEEK